MSRSGNVAHKMEMTLLEASGRTQQATKLEYLDILGKYRASCYRLYFMEGVETTKSAERDANDVQPTYNNCEVVRCRSSSFFSKSNANCFGGRGDDRDSPYLTY